MKYLSAKGIIAALLVVVVAGVCIRLGFWQLDRLEQRRARNAQLAQAMAAPPIVLEGELLASVAADPERYRYRRVVVEGEYEHSETVLLRGRGRQGTPGVHLVTPLRLEGGASTVVVDRGWLPAPDGATADPRPYREPGPVVVHGVVQIPPPPGADGPRMVPVRIDGSEVPTYQRIDLAALQRAGRLDLLPFYVERSATSGGEQSPPLAAPPPRLDDGPHLGYAVQWFGFAAVALIGFAVVAARERARS